MSPQFNILSTRPVGDDAKAIAVGLGVQLDELSFIHTQPLTDSSLAAAIQGLSNEAITAVFTSMNAVEAVAKLLKGCMPQWQIACIGQATRTTVEQLLPRCTVVATAPDAAALGNAVAAWHVGPVHFFCNAWRRPELPEAMQRAGVAFTEWEVYSTEATPHRVDKHYAAILFFSPSAVRSFFSVNQVTDDTVMFATGRTTAAAIRQHTTAQVIVAAAPGKAALLNVLWPWIQQHHHK